MLQYSLKYGRVNVFISIPTFLEPQTHRLLNSGINYNFKEQLAQSLNFKSVWQQYELHSYAQVWETC